MKYVSVDLETTGVDEKGPQHILQLSMIVEDTLDVKPLDQLPHLTVFIKQNKISGEPYALAMNAWILDIISGRKENDTPHEVVSLKELPRQIETFLSEHFPSGNGKIIFAGKNIAMFDYNFLPTSIQRRVSHRVLDPGTLFTNFTEDEKPPNLKLVKERCGLSGEVTHDAFDDALDIIKIFRTKY